MTSATCGSYIKSSRIGALNKAMSYGEMNNELLESLIIAPEQEPLTVFPDTWPTSAAYDMRTFSDLRPGTFVSQLRKHRTARGSEEGISIIPPLNETFIEPPVFVFTRVTRPVGLMFALRGSIMSATNKACGEGTGKGRGVPNALLLATSLAFSLASCE